MSDAREYRARHGGVVYTVEVRWNNEPVSGAHVWVAYRGGILDPFGTHTEGWTDSDGEVELWAASEKRGTIYAEYEGYRASLEDMWVEEGSGFTIDVAGEEEDN